MPICQVLFLDSLTISESRAYILLVIGEQTIAGITIKFVPVKFVPFTRFYPIMQAQKWLHCQLKNIFFKTIFNMFL